ncbi:MAG: hypothetical protein MUF83_21165 [Acidimicrobiales bacterium]|nr:hypothetical protein [Acidimicrobiales bacterium]
MRPAVAHPDPHSHPLPASAAAAGSVRPVLEDRLAGVRADDVVVVPGPSDHAETVLSALGVAHRVVRLGQLGHHDLRAVQLLVVNCPGRLWPADIARVRRFVAGGGVLCSTDRALRHVIEPGFPGLVAHDGAGAPGGRLRVEVVATGDALVAGIDADGAGVSWHPEGSPSLRVLDDEHVRVLLCGVSGGARGGERDGPRRRVPLAVTFAWGDGFVVHSAGHHLGWAPEPPARVAAARLLANVVVAVADGRGLTAWAGRPRVRPPR